MKKSFQDKTWQDNKKSFTNFRGLCKGCGICIYLCPKKCIKYSKDLGYYKTPAVEVEIEKCIACFICERSCPDCAIKIQRFQEEEKLITAPQEKALKAPKKRKLLK